MQRKLRIGICGSGNVAYHLVDVFASNGHSIAQVFSRNKRTAQELCDKVNASNIDSLKDFSRNLDLVILAVKDDAIVDISAQIDNDILCVHTSGSININQLVTERKGVFYPLQTFSKSKSINWNEVPICIEASNEDDLDMLFHLATQFSSRVEKIDSKQRKSIHVAAVFACNFTNHMLSIAESITEEQNVDYTLLHPLIEETFEKSMKMSPSKAQTGPASRNDVKLIEEHLHLLEDHPQVQNLYRTISDSILNMKKNEKL